MNRHAQVVIALACMLQPEALAIATPEEPNRTQGSVTATQPAAAAAFLNGHWCGARAAPVAMEAGLAGVSVSHCGPLTDPPTIATVPDPGGDPYGPSYFYRIPVVFHVVHNGPGEANGMLDISRVTSQIARLNADFAPSQIQFFLNNEVDGDGIVYHNNVTWFNSETAWSAATVDSLNNLNIFSLNLSPFGYSGTGNIPQGCGSLCVPVGHPRDVIRLDYRVIGDPAIQAAPFDDGQIATHEVGHYLGLYHTFSYECNDASPSCYGDGDTICDTPSHPVPTLNDCTPTDGCPLGGPDPVQNFMNYTTGCFSSFTPEQMRRMRCTIERYRPGLASCRGNIVLQPFSGTFATSARPMLTHVPIHSSTAFEPSIECPIGLSDGAGEGAFTYAGSSFLHQGNELGFRFTHYGGDLHLSLANLTTDLDLMLLSADGLPSATIARSENFGIASESIVLPNFQPGVYIAVVDTFDVNGGTFTLTYRGSPVGYNIDWETSVPEEPGAGVPASTFGGAAGQVGVWTPAFDTKFSLQLIRLAAPDGFVTNATLTNNGLWGEYGEESPDCNGDHALLLEDFALGFNGTKFTFANLVPGRYRLWTYAICPVCPNFFTTISVTPSPDGAQEIGGPWQACRFALGVTHGIHRVTVGVGDNIVVSLGSSNPNINGFQLVPRPPCPADINNSDTVDVSDLLGVINAWGVCPGCPASACPADLTGECLVNVGDLLALINSWGVCP